jgi:hypothetical protein
VQACGRQLSGKQFACAYFRCVPVPVIRDLALISIAVQSHVIHKIPNTFATKQADVMSGELDSVLQSNIK